MKSNQAAPVLPTDDDERTELPIFDGVLNYFPLAIAAVARWSKIGNDKHNPGEAMHWARNKSTDHPNKIARHLIDIETLDPTTKHYDDATALAWRALAKLQELEEKRLGKPMSRGSRIDTLIFPAEAAPAPIVNTPPTLLEKLKAKQAEEELERRHAVYHTASDFKPGPV